MDETPPPSRVTLSEILVSAMVVVVVLAPMLLVPLTRVREKANRSNCKGNQKQLGLALIMYRDSQGKNVNFPAFSGSAFLTALYVTGVNTEADQFICPSSGDDNSGLLATTGVDSPEFTSYAGRRNATQSSYPGLYTAKGASETTLLSDDSQPASGAPQRGEPWRLIDRPRRTDFNHGDCVIACFADGHVEEVPLDDDRMKDVREVGQGLLHPLAN